MSPLVLAFLHRPSLQLPFAVSLQGAALMVAAALLMTARRQLSPELGREAPWGWMGAFGLLRMVAVVTSVMMSQVNPGLSVDGFRLVYLIPATAGWLCAFEFGRRMLSPGVKGRWLWVWPLGGMLVVGGARCGWAGWMGWMGLGVALPAAAMIGVAIWKGGMKSGHRMTRLFFAAGLLGLAALELGGTWSMDIYQGYSIHRITEAQGVEVYLPEDLAAATPAVLEINTVTIADRVLAALGALAAMTWSGAWWWLCYRNVSARGESGWAARRLMWTMPLAMIGLVGCGFEMVRITIRGATEANAERRFAQLAAQAAAVDARLGAKGLAPDFGAWVVERGLTKGYGQLFLWREKEGRRDVVWAEQAEPGLPGRPGPKTLGEGERAMEELRLPYMQRPHREAGMLLALWHYPLDFSPDGAGWWMLVREDGVHYFGATRMQRGLVVVVVFMLGMMSMMFYLFYIRREGELALRIGRERAEASDRAKTELLARVSHELRTPLQGALGYAELMARAPLVPEQAGRLAAIREQGSLLLRLVNDLLDYGALQSGSLSLRHEVFRLTDVAESAWAAVRPMALSKGLEMATKSASGAASRMVRGDALRVRQVLVNLLGNAVKFTPAGGCVELGLEANGSRVTFSVSDSGPGVAVEDAERIFAPLERGRDEIVEGAGLGLPLARSLCVAMNGTLRLARTRTQGGGAVFVAELELPEADACVVPSVAILGTGAPFVGAGARPARVLVAEDNTLLRRLLDAQLAELGCEVTAVADGEAAVEAWRERRHEVVVLDLAMPRLNGRDAARRIRELSGDARRPWIVGLSAHASDEERAAGLAAGMNRFLSKPASLADLAGAMGSKVRGGGGSVATPTANAGAPAGKSSGAGSLVGQGLLGGAQRDVLWRAFAAETPIILGALEKASRLGDLAEARRHAHYLKSTALVMGAPELAAACERCERAATDGARAIVAVEAAAVITASRVLLDVDSGGAARGQRTAHQA